VRIHDVIDYNGTSHSILRAILMWCIHDFPAYGIMASCVTKEYHACPICGPWTSSHHSNVLSKHVYWNQHWRWLLLDHPFRENLTTFNGILETQVAPPKVDVNDIICWGSKGNNSYNKGCTLNLMTQRRYMASNKHLHFWVRVLEGCFWIPILYCFKILGAKV
jgi:hypothetical protein